ncbi:hypothetical protein AVEN_139830-1 [Araneus ventricosus]|uniref:Uncharacterized protein n=1 Tax=Araneus ventricosus TaxID=182803 RepID=A0A4Y2JCF4_ARAVE|nr:hypothetical protein AVEN_139830-1 [Araneus ventricosus]
MVNLAKGFLNEIVTPSLWSQSYLGQLETPSDLEVALTPSLDSDCRDIERIALCRKGFRQGVVSLILITLANKSVVIVEMFTERHHSMQNNVIRFIYRKLIF